ncbi:MAG: two-component regulator propeller domain-containing protein [Verrucomicrobiota bacterium]
MKRNRIQAGRSRAWGGVALVILGLIVGRFGGSAGAEVPRRYDIRVWQTDEGLPQNSVTALAQTPDGYLWVGTRGGLARFDGIRFTVPEESALAHLKEAPINVLCVTRDGSLWVGSDGDGLTRLYAGQVQRYHKAEGLADNQVQCLLETQDGALWIGGETGLTRFRDGRFTTFSAHDQLHNNSIKGLCEDGQGIIRVATVTGLVSLNAGGTVSSNNFGLGPVPGILKAVCADRQGRLWVGALNGLLSLTEGERGSFAANKTFPEKITTTIQLDSFGQLWVGTYSGLTRRQDGVLTQWALNATGINDLIFTIFEDREQNIWVGGRDGLYRLSPMRFTTLTTQDGLSYNNVTSVCEDRNGVMWFGTWGGGVNRWRDEQFTALTETNGLLHDTVLSLWPGRDGRVWVGFDYRTGGLDRITPALQNDFPRGNKLIPAPIRVVYEDRAGTTWVGTVRGLNALRGEQTETYTLTNGLSGTNVTAICESRAGRLWVGTEAGLSVSMDKEFTQFQPSPLLPAVSVSALFEDAATNLWVGTRGKGISRIKGGRVTNYTTRDGLFTDEVFEILEDDLGYFWMTSRRGIFRVSRQQFDAFDAGKIAQLNCTVFGREDGLATVQCNGIAKPAGWKNPDGRLWFATIRGVVTVEPRIRLNDLPPPVAVEEVVVDQQALRRRPATGEEAELLVIPPGSGRMEIHYTALSLQSPEKNRFKYRLADFDLEWVEAGHQRAAYYNNVPPGRYRFEVMACNNDGVWSKQIAQLALHIEPHFWQTWWFRATLVALPIGVVILIYRARLERLRELENLRIRIASDLHDDVGSRLTKMAMMTELADREMPTSTPGKAHILNISRTVRDITRAMDEIVWTINPRNDTVENLANYIFHYAQEYFQDTGIRCRLDLPPDLPDEKMSTEERHHLFMAVKEALNNILKHAAATEVRIALSIADKTMTISISDNGRGYHALTPDPTGDGMRNMRRRLEKIGGRFDIVRNAGGGTLVTMRLPVEWS